LEKNSGSGIGPLYKGGGFPGTFSGMLGGKIFDPHSLTGGKGSLSKKGILPGKFRVMGASGGIFSFGGLPEEGTPFLKALVGVPQFSSLCGGTGPPDS